MSIKAREGILTGGVTVAAQRPANATLESLSAIPGKILSLIGRSYNPGRHQIIVLLRWLLFLTLGYLSVLGDGKSISSPLIASVMGAYAISNILLAAAGEEITRRYRLYYAAVLCDVIFISGVILFTGDLDLYLAYFLALLISSFGQDLRVSFLSTLVATAVYSFLSYRLLGTAFFLSSAFLFRIPFFYLVSFITSLLSQDARAGQVKLQATERRLKVVAAIAQARTVPELLRMAGESVFDEHRWLTLELLAMRPEGTDFCLCRLSSGGCEIESHPLSDLSRYVSAPGGRQVIPLVSRDKTFGWIVARQREEIAPDLPDGELLDLMAANLVAELVRMGGESASVGRNLELATLINLNETINQTLDKSTVLDRVVAVTTTLLDVEAASILLVDEDTGDLLFQVTTGQKASEVKQIRIPAGTGIAGWVAREALPAVSRDAQDDPRFFHDADRRTGFITRSLAAAPLICEGKVIGVLEAVNLRHPEAFDDHCLNILRGIAVQAGTAIKMAVLNQRLHAETDEAMELGHRLEEEKSRVETILASMDEAVVVCDDLGDFVMMNRRGRALIQDRCQVSDGEESSIGEIETRMLLESIRDGREMVTKVKLPAKGTAFQLRTNPIINTSGKIQGGVAVMEDVTELQQLNEMKTEFVSQVSHELRTPLTAIAGAASILCRSATGNLGSQQLSLLGMIREESSHMTAMVTNLLDLSRREMGASRFIFRPGDLAPIIHQALASVAPLAMEKNITVDAGAVAGDLPPLSMDQEGIRRVLVNLLGNAVKFTPPEGKITVGTVSPSAGDATCREVTVWIRDTGMGIRQEELKEVFKKFYRCEQAREKDIQGTGLGLAISQQVIQAHGGRIWVESSEGQGSTFYFTLPMIGSII